MEKERQLQHCTQLTGVMILLSTAVLCSGEGKSASALDTTSWCHDSLVCCCAVGKGSQLQHCTQLADVMILLSAAVQWGREVSFLQHCTQLAGVMILLSAAVQW